MLNDICLSGVHFPSIFSSFHIFHYIGDFSCFLICCNSHLSLCVCVCVCWSFRSSSNYEINSLIANSDKRKIQINISHNYTCKILKTVKSIYNMRKIVYFDQVIFILEMQGCFIMQNQLLQCDKLLERSLQLHDHFNRLRAELIKCCIHYW